MMKYIIGLMGLFFVLGTAVPPLALADDEDTETTSTEQTESDEGGASEADDVNSIGEQQITNTVGNEEDDN